MKDSTQGIVQLPQLADRAENIQQLAGVAQVSSHQTKFWEGSTIASN